MKDDCKIVGSEVGWETVKRRTRATRRITATRHLKLGLY